MSRAEEGDCYVTFVFLQAGTVPRDLQKPQDWPRLNGKLSREQQGNLYYIYTVQSAMPRQARTSQRHVADAGTGSMSRSLVSLTRLQR
jgi:hypothetical protein